MNFILNILTPPIFLISYVVSYDYLFFKIFKKRPTFENFIINFIFLNSIVLILILIKIKVYLLIQLIFLLSIFLSIYVLILNRKKISLLDVYKSKIKIFDKEYQNYFFYLISLTYLIISLYPINDADSYAYHLSWPKNLIENPYIFFDLSFLEFRVVGIGEILNYISLSIFSENFQSFFAFILFSFLLIKYLKDKPILFFLCFSSPLIIKYIFTQKPFLIPSLLFALVTCVIYENRNNINLSKEKIILILGSISYVAMSKYTFIPIAFFLLIYFYIKFLKKNFKNILKYSILCFFLVCFPLLFAKIIYFQDPFSPFLEKVFNGNRDIIQMSNMYKNWDGFSSSSRFKIVNFAIPQSPFSWADTFGLILLFPFFYKLKNNSWSLLILLLITTSLVSYFSNFQARWYIPVFLTMLFLAEKNYKLEKRKIVSVFVNMYSLILFLFFFLYLINTLFLHVNYGLEYVKSKRIYLYSFLNSQETDNENYTLTNARNIFFNKNFIGYRYPIFSKSIILKNNSKKIKKGIFFGVKNLQEVENKLGIPLKCIDEYNFEDIKVAKRNIFSKEETEKVLTIKFKNKLIKCL